MLYCGLIYPLSAHEIVWGQVVKALIRRIFTLQNWAVRYTVGLKQQESFRDGSRQLKILTVYSLFVQETILYAKVKCNCVVNKQVHICNTRNNNDYHRYVHNLELHSSKPSEAGCIFYNKFANTKQIVNKNQFKKELKDLHIKGCYYLIANYLNEEFYNIGY
jgi:hypothetical protein